MIRKSGNTYVLYSKDGSKKLGTFASRAAAMKREQEINYFKHTKKKR